MNERIQGLAEQAKEYATTRHPVSNIVLNVDAYLFEQKFAELIVRECLSLAQSHRSQVDDFAAGIDYVRDEIKEHFGVE
jgi:hypothetical protein